MFLIGQFDKLRAGDTDKTSPDSISMYSDAALSFRVRGV